MTELPDFLPNYNQALLVTALRIEYQSVAALLEPELEYVDEESYCYESALFRGKHHDWQVWIVETGKGNERAALVVQTAIRQFRPELLIFVGVAGGIMDVAMGDVVVATKVHGYERRKDTGEKLYAVPDSYAANERLLNQAKAVERRGNWYVPVNKRTKHAPGVHFEAIAAGEGVIKSSQSREVEFIKQHYPDAVAVEMEGHGTMLAAHMSETRALVVRGISDLLDNKAAADSSGSQRAAARSAALFAKELLNSYMGPVVASTASVVVGWETVRNVLHDLGRRIESDFAPDLIVTMSGPGSFAACYMLSIRSADVPLLMAVTYPRRDSGTESFEQFRDLAEAGGWRKVETKKWVVFLPNLLEEAPAGSKILLLDDRVVSGETQRVVADLLSGLGHEVRQAAMFSPSDVGVDLNYVGRTLDVDFDMPWGRKDGRS